MTKVRITLGTAEAIAELDDTNAPATASWLRALLPLEGRATHSMENGREVYLTLPDASIPREENQTVFQTVGDLLVYRKPAIFVEAGWPRGARDITVVSFVYERDTAIRSVAGSMATNVVGTITSGLDALAHEAPRMRREGMGLLRFELDAE